SIKVDREERPDVDEIYMRAVQLLTGSGGWPMSVFLTPDQKPFWGGTYFPPDDRGGRPGFASILAALSETFAVRRGEVAAAADRLAAALRQMEGGRQFVATGPLDDTVPGRALEELLQTYDRHHGGFGGAPKFPPHGALELLLRATAAEPREDLTAITRGTLDGVAMGGIRDHVGGGFHRYATDAVWLVPHFEKMLYDNAQLASVYTEAATRWKDPLYRQVAEETLAWVLREMAAPEGGFYSALDADSEGGEGAYYLWSLKEITEVLGSEEGERFARVYGIEENGNFVDPVTGEEPGNIPHLKRTWAELARTEDIPEKDLRERMTRARALLLDKRKSRPAPGLDDKVVASWNGLMIGAFARAGRAFGRGEYVDAAARAARFVLGSMRREGRLLRSWRAGESKLPAYLEDHAFLAWGLLDLHDVTGESVWLDEARSMVDSMIERFWDSGEGAFFFVASDHESLIARTKEVFDQAVPSGNGMAARVLVRLWRATGEARYEEHAATMFRVFAGILQQAPRAAEHLLLAFMASREGKPRVAAVEGPAAAVKGGPAPLARMQRGPIIASADLDKRRIAPGETAELRLTLEIEPGWHVQSAKPSREDLVPTSVELGLAEGLAPGEMKFPDGSLSPIGGERLSVYAGRVTVRVPIRTEPGLPPGRAPIIARLRFQACDDKRCLAPEQVELSFAVEIG
ncbi:MAG TPA: DUF255 domain-containing protein, partial [Candidatus Limnocylindrales bacterium]|nr:DUF255 domain-containing protein [Candidatus Limnocylindrales bacterium]